MRTNGVEAGGAEGAERKREREREKRRGLGVKCSFRPFPRL